MRVNTRYTNILKQSLHCEFILGEKAFAVLRLAFQFDALPNELSYPYVPLKQQQYFLLVQIPTAV